MNILFGGGDIGGARALLPIIKKAIRIGHNVYILNNGFLSDQCSKYDCLVVSKSFIHKNNLFFSYFFSSSLKDTLPLNLAHSLKNKGVKVIHVLDNWCNYKSRLQIYNLKTFYPDYYAVMDDVAYSEAAKEGIDTKILIITGHPQYSEFNVSFKSLNSKLQYKYKYKKNNGIENKKLILFVSEPVIQDQGEKGEKYRGYTEKIIIELLFAALQDYSNEVQLLILPHPREDAKQLEEYVIQNKGEINFTMLSNISGRNAIMISDGVAGMASVLLYDSWLFGKPTISLQPGIKGNFLSVLKNKEDVEYVEKYEKVNYSIQKW